MSNIGKQYTFWNLIKEYKIVVPKIQRDYVQGRENSTVKKNREEFVGELVDALESENPMSLNFVYGTIKDGAFIPIDGQQRLTTLFLLHLYVFSKNSDKSDKEDISKLQERFSYETRYTTNRFLEALAKHLSKILENSYQNLSDAIRRSGWYMSSWEDDPNVLSCLVMLDAIDKKMNECKIGFQASEKLKGANCPITFMWLQLGEEFGSDNQLYIRMNSRGKQLTDFENFKAELYEKVLKTELYEKELKDDEIEEIKKKIIDFKRDIDGDWYSLFWDKKLCKDASKNKNSSNVDKENKGKENYVEENIEKRAALIDRLLQHIFHWTIVASICVHEGAVNLTSASKNASDELEKSLYNHLQPGCEIEKVYVKDYIDLYQNWKGKKDDAALDDEERQVKKTERENAFFDSVMNDFAGTLSFLTNLNNKKNNGIFKFIVNDVLQINYGKKQTITYTVSQYSPRVLLYAVTHFANKYYGQGRDTISLNDNDYEGFKSWYRVILNLVSTTEIDSPEDFQSAVKTINQCKLNKELDILEVIKRWLTDLHDKWKQDSKMKQAFRLAQVKEEILKLDLIKKDETDQVGWKGAILDAENTDFDSGYKERDYFRGQIGFLLLMAKQGNDYNLEEFQKYCNAVKSIFIDYYNDNLFHRALLTYKDYGADLKGLNAEEVERTVSSGIMTYFRYKRIHGAPDWRDALVVTDWEKGQCKGENVYAALKQFVDDFSAKEQNIQKFENEKINDYQDSSGLRFMLIKMEKMFEFTENYFIKTEREGAETHILLKKKTKSGDEGKNWVVAETYYDKLIKESKEEQPS